MEIYRLSLRKPDGRALYLYSRAPIDPSIEAPSPEAKAIPLSGAHLRWHPLRGEWVAYAGHRQNRTFLPPKEFNPLAPMVSPLYPTELPQGAYDVAVFENMFPTLSLAAPPPPHIPGLLTAPARGVCEVVVFTQDPESSLGRLPLEHIALIVQVWAERTRSLGSSEAIQYVMPFENRGVEVGVTLHHPHGQIYAYPAVPPLPAREIEEQRRYYEREGRGLLADVIARELEEEQRILYAGPHALAWVPSFARYPYEVWVAPRRSRALLYELDEAERLDLSRALKSVLLKYDGLWQRPFPYLMVLHQGPSDGAAHPGQHLHFEFSPAYRSPGKLKFLAGTELGAGFFANDAFPEDKARELRAVEVAIE